MSKYKAFSWYDFDIPEEVHLGDSRDRYLDGVVNTCKICGRRRMIKNRDAVCNSCIKYDTPHRRMYRRVKKDAALIMQLMNKQKGLCAKCNSSLVWYVLERCELICKKC